MLKQLQKSLVIILLVMLAGSSIGAGNANACKLYNGKLNIVITNLPGMTGGYGGVIEGTVGIHMISPNPYATGSSSHWSFSTAEIVEGTIPTGLQLLTSGRFEGTPEQQGNWEAKVVFKDVMCGGNQLGDHYIDVRFSIYK